MKQFFRKLLKVAGYTTAALVILLAVVVGLFRLFLPRLPEYQDDIENWAGNAIGMEVRFSGMNARWGLSGPEVEFYDTELIRPDNQTRLIEAELVSIGVSVTSLMFDQALVVDRVTIRDTSVEVRQLESGGWWIQGDSLDELPFLQERGPQQLRDMEIVGEDIEIRFLQPGDERPHFFNVPNVLFSIDANRIAVDADVRLPNELGRGIGLSATRLLGLPEGQRNWDVSIEADNIMLPGWSELHSSLEGRVLSGTGDVDVSFVLADKSIRNASLDADLEDVSLEEGRFFDLAGRIELDSSTDGWLVAAEDFQIATDGHEWPESTLRAEASTDGEGKIALLDLRATYVNLEDSFLLLPLLPEEQREFLANLAPSGEVRDLDATVSEIGGDVPYFDISVSLENVGFAADDKRPGVRGFTGYVKGDRPGGRIELESSALIIDVPRVFDGPVEVGGLEGIVFWRSTDELTRLSPSGLHIMNPVIESRGYGELTFLKGQAAPHIEYSSTYSISDVSAVDPYLPHKVMTPKLRTWFQTALVKGSIPRGTVRMNGVLDGEFFRGRGGNLLVEGSARNLTLQAHRDWPALEQMDAELVLDHTRLYSVKNRSVSEGNASVDAHVEIADLYDPVVTVKALTTGTLETMYQYVIRSPLNDKMGGNLERVTPVGDASFQFDLAVPLKRADDTTIDGLLRSNNGALSIKGFPAPIEDIIGEVTITQDYFQSDNLGARFLGEPVTMSISRSDDPGLFAVATMTGLAGARAIVEDLGMPLEGSIEGAMQYSADMLFPRGGQEPPRPLTIQMVTELEGLAITLPAPVGKPAEDPMRLTGELQIMPGGEVIQSIGEADNGMSWHLVFNRLEESWDFDRGVLLDGPGVIEPAETRGLHIRGATSTVRLEDWLTRTDQEDDDDSAADRIRSIDVVIEDLFAVGQHLKNHHVRLDRSALDWQVQVEGENVVGSIRVPYDFTSDRAMLIEMERLYLPGDEVSPPSPTVLDPRDFPPITLTADDVAFGNRNIGAVNLNIVRTEDGLEIESLMTEDESFTVVGSGRWVFDEDEELRSRTYITATLNSDDVESTLARLDFAEGISGGSMGVIFDLSWGGPPREAYYDVLDGEVQIRLENGALEEVEPGAGRMLGLVSFVALPRRLSLDFRDVFNKGFGYDEIAGNFTIEDGIAMTCDMSLEGPSALIGVVGQVDIAQNLYEQGAVISAKVGNTLPIVGAVVGGPPGAAAMLIFSQIFKKPLQQVGQVYYGIAGPWEEPEIEPIDLDEFVRYGDMANCLNETGPQ